ncbi:putative reverse transcriptase domain, ribonuclease H-like domain, aspartic peptidase domain protein [Tanacetum coccineum]
MARRPLGWKVVEHVSHKKFSNGGVIVVEDDPDVIHVDNSSDLALSTSLNDLEIAALHIDGQSIDVDAPPDIIDVVDEMSMQVLSKVNRYTFVKSSHTAKEMTWHATGKCTKPGLQHVAVILTTYNMPPWLCMKESSFMLTLLIPGPKSPIKDIDVYLRPSIDDLKVLWALKGVKTIDVATGQKFNMRAVVLWTINDFPARSSLSGWSGQGYKACPTCNEDTPSIRGKIVKPQAAYSFTPENRKKFCQYIKGVKLPDGFGSCFKHKVTDNDTNITGLKSHDCHIMMQRLLPYGLQNYLPDNIAKPIIELSSLFKQLCSATLMEDDMLKASVKVVEILCELERIYPPAFFDIMIHLPIHLALEALEGGPIHPRWMFPFERFMKKLKGYVRNKAKPEGSIAEGYVAEEALTLSSHYFRDVTTKFNRLERNVDPPPPTCQFQAFRSVCNTIGLRSFPPFGAKEFNKARWYVLHNSPEIDTYRAQFQSLFPEKNMLEEFTGWFRTLICERHANNLQDPEVSTTSELFALANGPSRTPMSVNACVVDGVRYVVQSRDERRTTQNSGICAPGPDGEMSYGQLQEILEFKYLSFAYRCESIEVDAPPDIIDVPGEDDDISDDEDPLPHDLADSDVEDLINDDDGVEKMADVARAHGGDGGGEDPSRPPPPSFGCAGCFVNRGKGKRKPNLGGVKAGRKTRERTRNQVLKDAVAANKGRPIEIGFEDRADNTVVPTGPYSTQWGNYFGEMIRSIPLYYPSWQKVPAGDKARLMATLGSTYNLEPHMRSERWPRIEGYIQAQFGKSYNTNKATLKREHWIRDPETGAYDLDRIRRGKPDEYTDDEWEKYINFWNDPANAQRAETNRLNRSKSTVVSRHGSRSIPLTRHLMKQASATQEEPSEIDTFYRLHTVNGVFQDPEALRMYDRMRELEATGEHTTAEINAMVRGGKLRGHIPGVGPVLPGYVRSRLSYSAPVDRSNDVDFMMSLMRSDDRFADAFARYDSGGASGSGGSRARDSEGGEDGDDTGREDGGDDTIVAAYKKNLQTFPQRHVAGERFVIELTPSMFPQRHVAGDRFPQRHVAGEGVRMLLGKGLITVVKLLIQSDDKLSTSVSCKKQNINRNIVNLASADAGYKAKAIVGGSTNSDTEGQQQVLRANVLQCLTQLDATCNSDTGDCQTDNELLMNYSCPHPFGLHGIYHTNIEKATILQTTSTSFDSAPVTITTTTIGVFPSNISGFSPATCHWGNLSLAKCRWGIVAGESSSGIQSPAIIPSEDVGPTHFSVKQLVPRRQTFPQRHVAGESLGLIKTVNLIMKYPQRHVAGERFLKNI